MPETDVLIVRISLDSMRDICCRDLDQYTVITRGHITWNRHGPRVDAKLCAQQSFRCEYSLERQRLGTADVIVDRVVESQDNSVPQKSDSYTHGAMT